MNHSSTFLIASLLALSPTLGLANPYPAENAPMTQRLEQVRAVSPALEQFTLGPVLGELWKRPQLSPRDRSIVTLSALIARNQPGELPYYLDLALDSGVKPGEISELITHLAFYSGWGNAMAAVPAVHSVFARRGIGAGQLPGASVDLMPLDEAAEKTRATMVAANFGDVAPGVVQNTTDLLFRNLWLRPGLAPRDRSLVTVSALVASGQAAQIPYHLNRAMDNGLTRDEASEVLNQLAFYASWPNVFTAMPVFKDVFGKRQG
ncbi:carboxymuconolactone decarboxylase family protein [Pseudomonas citronellolis]|jgi:4-carboxymuconolactone decarboxylase|uniref:carboxymuconolactone decarboxylase family protein n=1 Tax=Pseudomonas citronellolis TaxID=53408 RepID=UPI0038999FB6